MDKAAILKGLSEVQHDLQSSKTRLDTLVSTPIWAETITRELDGTVMVLQGLYKAINDLVDVQRNVLMK